jgi:hypothetical protein
LPFKSQMELSEILKKLKMIEIRSGSENSDHFLRINPAEETR